MSEFLAMGGYGAFVWPSYGLTAVIMVVLLIASLRGLKTTEAMFERLKAETGPIHDHNNVDNNNKTTAENADAHEA